MKNRKTLSGNIDDLVKASKGLVKSINEATPFFERLAKALNKQLPKSKSKFHD